MCPSIPVNLPPTTGLPVALYPVNSYFFRINIGINKLLGETLKLLLFFYGFEFCCHKNHRYLKQRNIPKINLI